MNMRPPNGIPVLGQQAATNEAVIGQIVQQMSLGFYTPLAAEHLASDKPIDPQYLQQLARDSQITAQAFFEALGMQFKKPNSPG